MPPDAAGLDLLIILCGCLRACADKEEIRGLAGRHIIIAGESLSGTAQNEDRLATLLAAEIDRFFPPPRD
ncbi:MAG: hypothetical protein ABSB31_02640 [Dehalococcoidia bacterium]